MWDARADGMDMPLQRGIRALDSVSTDSYDALCAVLWSERNLLESLACTVVVGQLVPHARAAARSGRTPTAAELELIEQLQLQEVLRAAVSEAVAEAAGLAAPATLAELATDAPEPWSTILLEHRAALRTLLDDIAALDVAPQLSLVEFVA